MKKALSQEAMKIVLKMQQNELTESNPHRLSRIQS